jgi:hypothetical protein
MTGLAKEASQFIAAIRILPSRMGVEKARTEN